MARLSPIGTLATALALLAPAPAAQRAREVHPPGGPVTLASGGARFLFTTIQEAVDASRSGDRIFLAPGTYRGPGNTDVLVTHDVEILGDATIPERYVVDCEESSRGFDFQGPGVTPAALLEGVTIRNGNVPSTGGGIRVQNGASPRVKACHLLDNHADACGGGVYVNEGAPTFSDLVVSGNTSVGGAGICLSLTDALVTASLVSDNVASQAGGGIAIVGQAAAGARVRSTDVLGNAARTGGGVYVEFVAYAALEQCRIANNVASVLGGGIDAVGSLLIPISIDVLELTSTLLVQNEAPRAGGIATSFMLLLLSNATVAGNRATASAAGAGVAVDNAKGMLVFNSIVHSNVGTPSGGDPFAENMSLAGLAPGFYLFQWSDVGGIAPGGQFANLDADPLFLDPVIGVDPTRGDFHVLAGSPCVDAGSPGYVVAPYEGDVDDAARLVGPRIDIGADEVP